MRMRSSPESREVRSRWMRSFRRPSLAAKSMNMDSAIGTIAMGMEADIIGVEGDPMTDITALTRVAFVMKGGKVYKNAK